MLAATAFVGFVVLAMACIAVFGPFGAVVWLVLYGLFHALCRTILRHVGDDADLYFHERITRRHRPAATSLRALANTRHRPPWHRADSASRPARPSR